MGLIGEIIDLASDPSVSMDAVLTRARVLASRIRQPEFEGWLRQELEGYTGRREDLPEYRLVPATPKAKVRYGAMGGIITETQDLPTDFLGEDGRHLVTQVALGEGVAVLQSFVDSGHPQHGEPIDASLVRKLDDMFQGVHLLRAWLEFSTSSVVGVLNAIRSRLLNYLLALERELGEETEIRSPLKQVPASVRELTVQTFNIHGGSGPIAVAGGTIEKPLMVVQADWQSLRTVLDHIGIDPEDQRELKRLSGEEKPDKGKLGRRAAAWIGKQAAKAVVGGLKVSSETAVKALTTALMQYHGLPPG